MVWVEKKANNMESNPLECWFAIDFSTGEFGSYRYFYIIPQYPSKDGVVVQENEPELYVLFESRCEESEFDDVEFRNSGKIIVPGEYRNGTDPWCFEPCSYPTFLRAFHTLDEAKKWAEFNVSYMNGLKRAIFQDDGNYVGYEDETN